ncbi:MAG: preprotein translocase subunit SecG [Bacteroidota bacterium]|nr:preprotein translocase subunit SecG [Bacteroidota bacterium]|tara:strand:- start:105 stop:323 length:219 start_codon:yes stop_codon:yes gene_type:complete
MGLLIFLIILVCIFLGLIVLVQNSKGGGLSSTFGGGNQIMGVKKTADVLEKTTWALAAILVALCLIYNIYAF